MGLPRSFAGNVVCSLYRAGSRSLHLGVKGNESCCQISLFPAASMRPKQHPAGRMPLAGGKKSHRYSGNRSVEEHGQVVPTAAPCHRVLAATRWLRCPGTCFSSPSGGWLLKHKARESFNASRTEALASAFPSLLQSSLVSTV